MKLSASDLWGAGETVAPYTGAWIETMMDQDYIKAKSESLPIRERGLKHLLSPDRIKWHKVAPYTGAWIETKRRSEADISTACRSLYGSVD